MVPLAIDSEGRRLDPQELKDVLVETCLGHHDSQRALAFAFLVYDFQSPAMRKVLEDSEYWDALDNLAGRFLTVFYIDSKDEINRDKVKRRTIKLKKDLGLRAQRIEYMTAFPTTTFEKTSLEEFIDALKSAFQIEEKLSPPFILFFQTEGSELIDCHFVALQEEFVESAFKEIKDHIKNAVRALKMIKIENYSNKKAIFERIKSSVDSGKFYKKIHSIAPIKTMGDIADLFGLLSFFKS